MILRGALYWLARPLEDITQGGGRVGGRIGR